jgi:hypothetical protein
MIGKSYLTDLPKKELPHRSTKAEGSSKGPLAQENMFCLSNSIQSIEGYNHAVIFVVCNAGYRWPYGMKLKSDMLKITVVKN